MDIINVKNVYKIYNLGENEVRALDGVDFSVKTGEFVSIIGKSGSGKSTLMNLLGCLDVPTSGEMLLDGKNVGVANSRELSKIRNQKIGFIFQGFNLIPTLTAIENVELPLIYRKIPKDKRRKIASESLDAVGLCDRKNHKPSEMSGGQQQRVAIARAIATKPPIMLADEPTGNLDSASGDEIMKILIDLNKSGKTIVLITHDNKIADMADRKIKIADGKII